MGELAIEANSLSKKYRIGRSQATSFRESFSHRLTALLKKKEGTDPQEFWALKDVTFQIQQGDVVGVIGKNGAGKSTLLKLISNIIKPTYGHIDLYGRVASLLEVGTGFHPELTGRENIFLNGTILGMSRAEVSAKFEEIVEFSGVAKFIDTPVKRYSSGMTVRLAFAVAAHLEPEILIVDEVLAVGDAEFQKKCLGKMDEVSKKEGRTILFVSHSLPALKSICRNGMLLEKGRLLMQAPIDQVIKRYSSEVVELDSSLNSIEYYDQEVLEVTSLKINDHGAAKFIQDGSDLNLEIDVLFKKRTSYELDLHIKKDDDYVASYANFVHHDAPIFEPGLYRFHYHLKLPDMLSGYYSMELYFTEPFIRRYAGSRNGIRFELVNGTHSPFLNVQGMTWGKVLLKGDMTTKLL